MPKRVLSSIEIFSGAGGLALGVAAAGFKHRMLLEYNRDACKTLRANSAHFGDGECDCHGIDVRGFDFRPLAGVDLLAAGAPCQPFSIGGKHRADQDHRNLFPQVFRAVREIGPSAILIENVKGLLRPSLADFVEYIELQLAHPFVTPKDPLDPQAWSEHLTRLKQCVEDRSDRSELQYRVRKVLLNAADFGVPQRRERVFWVAIRKDLGASWAPPIATHSHFALQLAQVVTGTYWKKHRMRRALVRNHPRANEWSLRAGNLLPWVTVRDALTGLPSPLMGKESEEWLNHVGQPGARSYPGHTGSQLDSPAKTVKAGVHGVPGGENMVVQANGKVRYFTVREAARIQTFPDNYRFMGAWGEAMRQIGNAVPVRLASAVGESIRSALLSRSRKRSIQESPASFVQAELPGLLTRSA